MAVLLNGGVGVFVVDVSDVDGVVGVGTSIVVTCGGVSRWCCWCCCDGGGAGWCW